jgi:hypothetical protein
MTTPYPITEFLKTNYYKHVAVTGKEVRMLFRRLLLTCLTMLIALSLSIKAFSNEQKPPSNTSSAQERQDFGVSDIEVQSVKTLDIHKLNAEVNKAASQGETWTKDAVLVALKFVGAGLKGNTKTIDVRTPSEQRDTATITITESGYLDDAVNGERWRLWLEKGANGAWTIKRALWAQLCSRPGRRFYSAEKCP